MINLYKDGDHMGMETDCCTNDIFVEQLSSLLSALIDNKNFETDWEFQLNYWLRDYIKIYQMKSVEISGKCISSGACGGEPFATISDDYDITVKGERL